jgi:hypothetical protein
MQRYTVYIYLETTLHVSGGTSTHHQERIQLYAQHLVFVTPLLLSATVVEELEPVWVCCGWRTPPTAHSNRFQQSSLSGNSEFQLRLDYGRSPHANVNPRLQIQLELLMMSGVPLETCWAFNERWNNKFYYKVASGWLFLLSHTAMHGSMNIKCSSMFTYL